jgi:hypothetical protein
VQVRARETGDLVICSLVLYEAVVRSIECEGLCLWLMASVRKREGAVVAARLSGYSRYVTRCDTSVGRLGLPSASIIYLPGSFA